MRFVGFSSGVDEVSVVLDMTLRYWVFDPRRFDAKFRSLLQGSKCPRRIPCVLPGHFGNLLES
jgi:hypothetical protein